MTYKVSVSSPYNFTVKSLQSKKYKTSLNFNIEIMPQSLDELADVQLSGNNYNGYVLMYDSVSGKWVDKNPDEVLSAATTELDANRITTTLPTDFETKLDIDLDDRIDLDAGGF
jgi:hypothetical protein